MGTRRKSGADRAVNAEWALVEQLAGPDWRLIVTGEKDGKATAEVAHEILFKTWPALKRWLEDERDFLVWRGELGARREEYNKAGREGARRQRQALLMGLPLDTAKKWLAARRSDIEPADQAFIEASVRAERAAARTWRWVQAAVGVLMLGIIASLLGVIFKDEIGDLWFEQTTLRRYIAANFTPYVRTPEAERALKPGDTFRECAKDCPEMVVVPAGEFWMGSPDGEGHDPEYPRHKVKTAKPFAVGKFEVTWDDWEACVAMRGCDGTPISDSGWGKGRLPVINVSWDQAKAYVGQQFVQQLQPLRRYLYVQICHAGHIAAGSVKAGDKSNVNRVGPYTEDDWNARCRCLRRQRRSSATGGYKYGNLIMNQLRGKLRQSISMRLRPSILDVDVLALYIACHSQPLAESSQTDGIIFRRSDCEDADHRHRLLLRACRERPRRRRAAEQRDELAPRYHSITSSARASSLSGIWRPSALAVLRLMTSSNFVGCSIGRSPGFAPARILAT